MKSRFEYIRDPAAIYQQSFSTIDRLVNLDKHPASIALLVKRVVHACGLPEVADHVCYSQTVVSACLNALTIGAKIYCDCEMVMHGIIKKQLPDNTQLICTLNDTATQELALKNATTRSAAAVDLWDTDIQDSIVVIGNAPTALFRLLERILQEDLKPAAIIGIPVGFIGAQQNRKMH